MLYNVLYMFIMRYKALQRQVSSKMLLYIYCYCIMFLVFCLPHLHMQKKKRVLQHHVTQHLKLLTLNLPSDLITIFKPFKKVIFAK